MAKIFLSLYYHIPFCSQKCDYCNFFSLPLNKAKPNKILTELTTQTKELIKSFDKEIILRSIYFGGGTPSLILNIKKSFFKDILTLLFPFRHQKTEITCEINPEDLNQTNLQALKEAGINRISLGIQTLSPRLLKLIGRKQKYTLSQIFQIPLFFKNWSFDIIYGIPTQTINDIQKTLSFFLENKNLSPPPHLSTYLLEIKEGATLLTKNMALPSDETIKKHYQFICSYLKDKGYCHYEVSNFAIPPYFSKHNLAYWNEKNYLALGKSGVGKFLNLRYTVLSSHHYQVERENYHLQMLTYVIMKLRTKSGINDKTFERKFGISFKKLFREKINWLEKLGYGKWKGNNFYFEEKDWIILNSLLAEFWS